MNKPIIEVRNLSKKYTLGERQPYYSFRDTISGIFHTPFRREKLEKDEFWALKDVSFDVNQGDVVGVIGRNGAGKSTLLKILSQITPPTEGEVKLRGRVASLLEVGTGFHFELTGRENIYLNGAILGMKRWEINNKFKEIVEFSEIEKFLDTPVKHYSSGMYMRLAFAVAAHLEPEILMVDEVLAVGDAQFQKKCLGKMSDVSKQGRTVIFVSHNMIAIKQLCSSVIIFNKGEIQDIGTPNKMINQYDEETQKNNQNFSPLISKDKNFTIKDFKWTNDKGDFVNEYISGKNISWEIYLEIANISKNINIVVALEDNSGNRIFAATSKPTLNTNDSFHGVYKIMGNLENIFLAPGRYTCSFGVRENNNTVIYEPNLYNLFIVEDKAFEGQNGLIRVKSEWKIIKI